MALPIINDWQTYFSNPHEGLGSSYERIILNDLLLKLQRNYKIKTVLEAPCFGFTGITGLNSVALAQAGSNVVLLDHNEQRIEKINQVMHKIDTSIGIKYVNTYSDLPFGDQQFDMSWNFSAMWFVEDISKFLSEFTRVTRHIILLCVPNQSGLGYKWQKANSDIPQNITFHQEFINPYLIKQHMSGLKWRLVDEAFIDCPPWPDIGMSKEKFLGHYLMKIKPSTISAEPVKPVSILDYYAGTDPVFYHRMKQYSWLEQYAPDLFKKYWSHHKWMLFEPLN